MGRKRRVEYEGAIYHVTQRGAGRGLIFMDDADRRRFMENLDWAVGQDGIRLYLYCLMPNHLHLLVETPQGNLSRFMHRLQTAYTLYFNLRHDRTGHLVQGRYGAVLVKGDRYLLNLSRYIHLNPVAHEPAAQRSNRQRLARLNEYIWSSFRSYSGLAPVPEMLDDKPLLALMGKKRIADRRDAYRRFVEAGLSWPLSRWEQESGFDTSRDKPTEQDSPVPVPGAIRGNRSESVRRVAARIEPEEVVRRVASAFGVEEESLFRRTYGGGARTAAIYMLMRHSRMTQRAVRTYLGFGTPGAVCRQMERFQRKMRADPELNAFIQKLSAAMTSAG
ncbi:MAG TPA: transposase [Kiritimatiellia bacterium]|jgi:REP element-mobilizing transposase RayT|nr:hypothetical protein [Lentisphaerota bacterium]HOU21510.1 transposase [Kiritimatiellia bacterium]HQQ59716.1 transposase [Kiritimatiellia bacterium]